LKACLRSNSFPLRTKPPVIKAATGRRLTSRTSSTTTPYLLHDGRTAHCGDDRGRTHRRVARQGSLRRGRGVPCCHERLEDTRVAVYCGRMPLVAFRCEKCFHAGPIAAAALPRLAVCSRCAARSLVPALRTINRLPAEPSQPSEPTTEERWAAYYGDAKPPTATTRPRMRRTRNGKVKLSPRVAAQT
jgi:hypothetical protein